MTVATRSAHVMPATSPADRMATLAWWARGSAAALAPTVGCRNARDLYAAWSRCRAKGLLPQIARPPGGFDPSMIFGERVAR